MANSAVRDIFLKNGKRIAKTTMSPMSKDRLQMPFLPAKPLPWDLMLRSAMTVPFSAFTTAPAATGTVLTANRWKKKGGLIKGAVKSWMLPISMSYLLCLHSFGLWFMPIRNCYMIFCILQLPARCFPCLRIKDILMLLPASSRYFTPGTRRWSIILIFIALFPVPV